MLGYAERGDKIPDMRRGIIGTLGNEEDGTELWYLRYDVWYSLYIILQSLRNAWATEEESEKLSVSTECFSDFSMCDEVLSSPESIINTIIHGSKLHIRETESKSDAIFGVVGDTEVLIERKAEDEGFEELEKESFPSHEAIPELSEYLMNREYNFLA